MHNHERYSLIVALSCAIMIIPALWFPSWHIYLVVASILCLAALPALCILLVLIWALTRFMTKEDN